MLTSLNGLDGAGDLRADGGGDDGTVDVLGGDQSGRGRRVGLGLEGRGRTRAAVIVTLLVVGLRGGIDEALDPGGSRVGVDVEVVEVVLDNVATGADGVSGVTVVAKTAGVAAEVGELAGRAREDTVRVGAVEVVVRLAASVADVTEDESGDDWEELVVSTTVPIIIITKHKKSTHSSFQRRCWQRCQRYRAAGSPRTGHHRLHRGYHQQSAHPESNR